MEDHDSANKVDSAPSSEMEDDNIAQYFDLSEQTLTDDFDF